MPTDLTSDDANRLALLRAYDQAVATAHDARAKAGPAIDWAAILLPILSSLLQSFGPVLLQILAQLLTPKPTPAPAPTPAPVPPNIPTV